MKFPRVYPLTIPSSQSTMRIIAIVSSMCCLLSATALRAARSLSRCHPSNGCTVYGGYHGLARPRAFLILCFLLFGVFSPPAWAQDPAEAQPLPRVSEGQRVAPFLAGAAIGLAAHEAGHVMACLAFGERPGLAKIDFHGIPFFAI